jgi:hypothetical protein
VPVWIDIREQPWPEVPAVAGNDWELLLDDERRVHSPLYANFFVRSYIISADGKTLYNLEEGRVRRYTPEPDLYLEMLNNALTRFDSDQGRQKPSPWRLLRL